MRFEIAEGNMAQVYDKVFIANPTSGETDEDFTYRVSQVEITCITHGGHVALRYVESHAELTREASELHLTAEGAWMSVVRHIDENMREMLLAERRLLELRQDAHRKAYPENAEQEIPF